MFNRTELSAIVQSELDSLLWSCTDEQDENMDEFYTADDATMELRTKL